MKSAAMNNTTLDRLLVIVLFAIMFLFEGQTKILGEKNWDMIFLLANLNEVSMLPRLTLVPV